MGNYTDEVTAWGTGMQLCLGLTGADIVMDIRDIVYDFHKWEWSFEHVGQTGFDVLSVAPLIGALKYSDEVVDLVKGVNKTSDVVKNVDRTTDVIKGTSETVAGGTKRAKQFANGWGNGSLYDSIKKFAPGSTPISTTSGKLIYTNNITGIQVVYDKAGNYFRIEDTNILGKRRYLDLDGNSMTNKIVNGKQMGRPKGEYQQLTHFNNLD